MAPDPVTGPTSGILIIGEEILSGKVEDENARYLVRTLRALGVLVRRIDVIPDAIDDIAEAVVAHSRRYDHVFTSGGVGPTHDDVTLPAIARLSTPENMPHVKKFEVEIVSRATPVFQEAEVDRIAEKLRHGYPRLDYRPGKEVALRQQMTVPLNRVFLDERIPAAALPNMVAPSTAVARHSMAAAPSTVAHRNTAARSTAPRRATSTSAPAAGTAAFRAATASATAAPP